MPGAVWTADDRAHMAAALRLAARGLGRVAPNPSVGCVLVKDDAVVGRGWTQPGGRPHGETEALGRAGAAARGATAYVSLEPCAHHGQTPPCAEALAEAGVARVVAACEDPDPRVAGKGLAALEAAGVRTEVGLLAEEARTLNLGFLLRLAERRPLVTLKLAASIDGRIATRSGESQWITGAAARAHGHLLRATHDAVLVGSGTAASDNPELTVRLPGLAPSHPLRVVLDGRLATPLTHKLVTQAREIPTLLFTRSDNPKDRTGVYKEAGVEVVAVELGPDGRLDLHAVMAELAGRGVTRLLVEGGSHVAAGLLRAGLVDRILSFRAGLVLGGEGLAAISGTGLEHLAEAPRFELQGVERLGADLLETWGRTV
jgi:diaminohydroxyphosphoribosylaminopyrimidine deaminase/5-amino-6-(5-phosphoribosylamino)uracil reductase